jgi:hypothetical protein
MNIWPGGRWGWLEEHHKLVRRHFREHEAKWRHLTGLRRVLARLRAERQAWKYAAENLRWDNDPHKMY